jgi:hypothetical protein
MTTVFRHTDDDGELSVFASGEQVLFVCSHGHWWVVSAKETGVVAKAAADRALKGAVPDKPSKADVAIAGLADKFGPGVFRAMARK